jgi:hypothetical protein
MDRMEEGRIVPKILTGNLIVSHTCVNIQYTV